MSAEGKTPVFEPLPLKQRALVSMDANQYRVWNVSGESKEIKADTACEAFRMVGQKGIIKIERLSNFGQTLIEKSKLAESAVSEEQRLAKEAGEGENLFDHIRRRRNPLISADELDELMRSLLPPPSSKEVLPEPEPAQAMPASEMVATPLPVPQPEMPQSDTVPGAIGLDVHGDGFDEIIPTSPAAVKPVMKHSEPKPAQDMAVPSGQEAVHAAAVPPVSEKELSPEEVEKLLSGKAE